MHVYSLAATMLSREHMIYLLIIRIISNCYIKDSQHIRESSVPQIGVQSTVLKPHVCCEGMTVMYVLLIRTVIYKRPNVARAISLEVCVCEGGEGHLPPI